MTKLLFINKGILVALLFLFGCSEDSVTEPQVVHGCLDSQACNYNSNATIDNNSCYYLEDKIAEGYCSCDDELEDCNGDCGGSVVDADEDGICDDVDDCDGVIDACGVCESDTSNDCVQDECGVWGGSGVDEGIEVLLWSECYNIEETDSLELGVEGLTGQIPSEIENLTNLTYLGLYGNQLTGEIPPEIGNLTNLTQLHLFDNQLTGEIPPEIGNLINLTELYLGNNQLTGEIPQEVCDLIESYNLNMSDILQGNDNLINTCD